MRNSNNGFAVYTWSQAGIWAFFVITIIGMLVYPGGTIHEPGLDSYSFLNNFFSDLGRSQDFEGNTNPSRWLLTSAVTLVGLSTTWFFLRVNRIFRLMGRFRNAGYAVAFFGALAGLAYIGIAFTPWDLFFEEHILFVQSGFVSFLVMSIIFTVVIYKSPDYPDIYGHIFLIFDLLLAGYVYLLFYGPDPFADPKALHINVVAQKIIVYAEIICMLVQIRGARNVHIRLLRAD